MKLRKTMTQSFPFCPIAKAYVSWGEFIAYLVDCIWRVVSGSSNILTMGSVSCWSCFSCATTVVLFSFKAARSHVLCHFTSGNNNLIILFMSAERLLTIEPLMY